MILAVVGDHHPWGDVTEICEGPRGAEVSVVGGKDLVGGIGADDPGHVPPSGGGHPKYWPVLLIQRADASTGVNRVGLPELVCVLGRWARGKSHVAHAQRLLTL